VIYLALIFLWVISIDVVDTWDAEVRPWDSLR
jgi:hypothetical protein